VLSMKLRVDIESGVCILKFLQIVKEFTDLVMFSFCVFLKVSLNFLLLGLVVDVFICMSK
jgi:hypothetical protein